MCREAYGNVMAPAAVVRALLGFGVFEFTFSNAWLDPAFLTLRSILHQSVHKRTFISQLLHSVISDSENNMPSSCKDIRECLHLSSKRQARTAHTRQARH